MLQHLLVFLIVIAAALSAAWRLAGVATRLRLLDALLRHASQGGVLHGWLARRAHKQRAALVSGGCAACANRTSHRDGAGRR